MIQPVKNGTIHYYMLYSLKVDLMKQKIKIYTIEVLRNFTRRVLPYSLAIFLLVGLSFFFWGKFSWSNFSDRLIIVGLIVALVGGVLISGQTIGGRNWGTPVFTAAQADLLTDFNIEVRNDVVTKFTPFMRFFLIGLVVFLVGILVYFFT
jgi:hypothetical protein